MSYLNKAITVAQALREYMSAIARVQQAATGFPFPSFSWIYLYWKAIPALSIASLQFASCAILVRVPGMFGVFTNQGESSGFFPLHPSRYPRA